MSHVDAPERGFTPNFINEEARDLRDDIIDAVDEGRETEAKDANVKQLMALVVHLEDALDYSDDPYDQRKNRTLGAIRELQRVLSSMETAGWLNGAQRDRLDVMFNSSREDLEDLNPEAAAARWETIATFIEDWTGVEGSTDWGADFRCENATSTDGLTEFVEDVLDEGGQVVYAKEDADGVFTGCAVFADLANDVSEHMDVAVPTPEGPKSKKVTLPVGGRDVMDWWRELSSDEKASFETKLQEDMESRGHVISNTVITPKHGTIVDTISVSFMLRTAAMTEGKDPFLGRGWEEDVEDIFDRHVMGDRVKIAGASVVQMTEGPP